MEFTETSNTETTYAYSVGRIRELENTLLNKVLLDKMIEAPDLVSSLNILRERGFESYGSEAYRLEDWENSLDQELLQTYKIIKDLSPYPFLYEVFALNYDFHNLKVLIKAKYRGKKYNTTTALVEIGTVKVKNLIMAIEEEKFVEIPVPFEVAVKKLMSEYNKFPDPEIIDLLLDKEKYIIILSLLKDKRAPFLEKFIRVDIDLNNILIAIRTKIRGEDKNFLRKALIEGGNLNLKNLTEILDSPLSSWNTRFAKTDYEKMVELGLKSYEEFHSLLEIERLMDNFRLDYVKIGKFITLGMEPLIGFIIAKEIDLKNIRLILRSKLDKLSPTKIKERIREAYV